MKRSLDMEGLNDALPLTCRMGMLSDRQFVKRVRHQTEQFSVSPSHESHITMSPRVVYGDRQLVENLLNGSVVEQERVTHQVPLDRSNSLCSSPDQDPFRAARDFNPFPAADAPKSETLDRILSSLPSPKKKLYSSQSDSDAEPRSDPLQTNNGGVDKLFTREEVRTILNRALSIQGTALRAEYQTILQNKLAEQFQSFTKFNQDYISRQIKGNPFSYVS